MKLIILSRKYPTVETVTNTNNYSEQH